MIGAEENPSFQQLSVLDLLKSHVQSQRDAIAALENKALNNFTIINIIVAIVATLNLDLGAADSLHQVFSERPLLLLIFVGYLIVVVLSLYALAIRRQASVPMEVSVQNAIDWSSCEPEHHLDILIRSYVAVYKHNERIVVLKGRRVKWAYTAIGVVIAAIFVEALGMLPVLIYLLLGLLPIVRQLVERYTALLGIILVCVLFAPSLSLRFSLLSQTKAAASALAKPLGAVRKRFRRWR